MLSFWLTLSCCKWDACTAIMLWTGRSGSCSVVAASLALHMGWLAQFYLQIPCVSPAKSKPCAQ